jgi:cobalt/nickel transport protein
VRRSSLFSVVLALAAVVLCRGAAADAPGWKGVDETVIEKVATEAGHPPRPPLVDTERGDLPLFLFLTAGAIGGFVAGYAFRALFPPKSICSAERPSLEALTLTLSQRERGPVVEFSQRERGHVQGGSRNS